MQTAATTKDAREIIVNILRVAVTPDLNSKLKRLHSEYHGLVSTAIIKAIVLLSQKETLVSIIPALDKYKETPIPIYGTMKGYTFKPVETKALVYIAKALGVSRHKAFFIILNYLADTYSHEIYGIDALIYPNGND